VSDETPIRILKVETLADDWAKLTKYTFERRHSDGRWHRHVHQAYERGNGVCILPVDQGRGTVLLVRQFRLPVWLTAGGDGMLIEACAGRLDDDDPEAGMRREAEEELGCRFGAVRKLAEAYMSPGSVTERMYFYTADYTPASRVTKGGGAPDEGEDIEILEMPLAQALAMVARGEIIDAKTIMLLQFVAAERRA
jgi:nudix-type nucleoside diphosphatase (YffH/AdpP family)